ncbi:unknown [Bacteroides sp. CAG:661]|nr:unknown [Bacteroides sp. CAG:661]
MFQTYLKQGYKTVHKRYKEKILSEIRIIYNSAVHFSKCQRILDKGQNEMPKSR